jgi:hypothetical protein
MRTFEDRSILATIIHPEKKKTGRWHQSDGLLGQKVVGFGR